MSDVNALVAAHFSTDGIASKKQIMSFFQEHLATKRKLEIPESAIANIKKLFEDFSRRLAA